MSKPGRALLALVPVVAAALVYHSITENYFLGDDFPNLFLIEYAPVGEYLVKPHGEHILFTRNLIFFVTEKIFGPVPVYFFWCVLLTHLLNAWLFFRVIERFTRSPLVACFGATLWATSPVHEEPLGWYSVYGHVLVGTILLVILRRAAVIASGEARFTGRVLATWLLLALVAATCFGTGIGVAMALPIVAVVLLPAAYAPRRRVALLFVLVAAVPLLYLGLLQTYAVLSGTAQQATHVFAAVLSFWDRAAVMLLQLIAYATSRFALGLFVAPRSFQGTSMYAAMAAFWGAVLWLGWRSPRARRPMIACLLLLVAVYGTIAVGRAPYFEGEAMEKFLVGQERYHYVGFLFPTLLLCFVLSELGSSPRLPAAFKGVALAAWLALSAAAYARFGLTIDHHDRVRTEVERVLSEIHRKAEETPAGQPVFVTNRYFEPAPPYLFRMEDFPGWAGVFAVFHPENTIDGRRVYFMQRPPWLRQVLIRTRGMSALIVPPRPGLYEVEKEADNPFREMFKELRRSRKKAAAERPSAQPSQ